VSVLRSHKLTIRNRTLIWGMQTYLMGILNITPDSFSGDGLLGDQAKLDKSQLIDTSLSIARGFIAEGVDIIDIGGESTRPGSAPTSLDEEKERVLPIIQALSDQLDVLISIDTYKADVAQAALESGADIVNDVWGLHADPGLAEVVAHFKAPIILMHNRSSWAHAEVRERLGGRYIGIPYEDLIEDIKRELMESVDAARAAGITDEHIILDPGVGFGKTVEQNLELVNRVDEIRKLGFPVLLGASRKSFIGYTLDLPPEQRLEGTAAAVTVGIVRGADIVRVHDVPAMARVARMTDAIVRHFLPE
jgi:dihydropteroate synthase